MWIALPVLIIVMSLACFNGLAMYAVYADCDPLTVGEIQRIDQVMKKLFIRVPRKKGIRRPSAVTMIYARLQAVCQSTWK